MKNIFFFIVISFMMIGNVSTYAADEKTVNNSLSAFITFLQKKREEVKARTRRDANGERFPFDKIELDEIEKLIELTNSVNTDSKGVDQNDRLSPEITDYITTNLFPVDEYISGELSEILEDPLFPFRMSFPIELIQILSSIAADRALSQTQVDYLKQNSIPFDYEKMYYSHHTSHGRYMKTKKDTPGYIEERRRTSIRALGAIGKHQNLPFDTLLILAEGMTNPLENGYVNGYSFEALKAIGPGHSLFLPPEINEKFERLFTIDINYWTDSDEISDGVSKVDFMQRQWLIQSRTADLFTVVAKSKKIPSKLLTRMTNILFYQLDEAKLKGIQDLDFAVGMSFVRDDMPLFVRESIQNHLNEQRNEALASSQKRLINRKILVVESFGEIGRYQVLPDEVIQAMERLSSSEKEHPDVKKTLQEALVSVSEAKKFLTEKPTGSVCESSMRNSEEGD